MPDLTAEERATLRARHRKNTDLSPRSYCTNGDHLHGDHAWAADADSSFTDWPCPVIRLLDELERLELSEPASRAHPTANLFDAIRIAQDLGARDGESIGYLADLICNLFRLNPYEWAGEVAAEIGQEHGKWVRT